MDQQGDCIIETNNQTHHHDYYLRKTLQFLVPISIICFLLSYFSGFPFFFHDLQFHSLVFPVFAQALDRKCMFLICNGILAFLANNLKHIRNSNDDEDGAKQIPEEILVIQENEASSMEYADTSLDIADPQEKHKSLQQGDDYGSFQDEAEETTTILESDEEEEDDDEEKEEETLEETLVREEVNDLRVSTEELNKKFEEFIRRMKEEIRIDARQQYMIAV